MTPLVSVILPVYNREDTIKRALDSVLMQTYHNIEVIVIDDGSTDATAQVIRSYCDSRLSLICQPSNCGANVARNEGIRRAKGAFIAFQDSDDEWVEDKLDRQINYMLEMNVSVCYCPYILHEGNRRHIVPGDYKNRDLCERNIEEALRIHNVIGTPTLIVKKDILFEIGLFDEEMERMQDYELAIRLVKRYRIGYIDEPLVNAYRMEKSISAKNEILTDTYARLLEKHIDFFDIDQFLYGYYRLIDHNGERGLEWENVERIAGIIGNCKGIEAERDCYRFAMQYMHRKYQTIKGVFREWYLFCINNIRTGEFAIYGAGLYGQRAYKELKKKNCIPRYFLVTQAEEKNMIEGVPIISLAECYDTQIPVIIAVSWETQGELIKNLFQKNMYRFCIYPFCHCR